MKPSQYIQTSDFLTIAKGQNTEVVWNIPQITIDSSSIYRETKTFSLPNLNKRLLNFLIKDSIISSTRFVVGSNLIHPTSDRLIEIRVFQQANNEILVSFYVISTPGTIIPAQKITIKVVPSAIPDLF